MDFVAEIILGYIDIKILERLDVLLKDKLFKILRYRDDYRIFVNDVTDGDNILKCINEILIEFGFKLNTSKTYSCSDIITGSIKPDKLEAIQLGYVPENLSKKELVNQLLIIQQLGKKYPNSGTLKARLSSVVDAVQVKDFDYHQELVVSILTDIAYNNPSTFPIISSLISNCISKMSLKNKKNLLDKIEKKLCGLSNIGLIEIWMQRISVGFKIKLLLNEPLCKLANGDKLVIFMNDWVSDVSLKKVLSEKSFIDVAKITKLKPVIEKKEVQLFEPYY